MLPPACRFALVGLGWVLCPTSRPAAGSLRDPLPSSVSGRLAGWPGDWRAGRACWPGWVAGLVLGLRASWSGGCCSLRGRMPRGHPEEGHSSECESGRSWGGSPPSWMLGGSEGRAPLPLTLWASVEAAKGMPVGRSGVAQARAGVHQERGVLGGLSLCASGSALTARPSGSVVHEPSDGVYLGG